MKQFLLVFLFLPNIFFGQLYFPPTISDDWQSLTPQSLGWKSEKLDDLKQFLIDNDSKSFMILKDGKIVVEYYMNGHDKDKQWYWASAGKCLTSVLVGFAEADGKLGLQESSSKYLGKGWSSLTESQEADIKVWNHITMTTGLDEAVSFECTDKDCLQYKAKPGTRWSYHNSPYTLLDNVITNASGQNLNVYFKNKLGNAIGMSGAFIKVDYNNVFYSTMRSMARFGLFCLAKGSWDGKQILNNASYINAMTKPSQNLNPSYGYLFWLNGQEKYMLPGLQIQLNGPLIPAAPASMYSALGKNEQRVYVVPDQNIVVVRMGDKTGNGGANVSILFDNDLWKKLSDIMNLTTSVNSYPTVTKEKVAYYLKDQVVVRKDIQVANVEVFNLSGVLQATAKNVNNVNVSSMTNGVYLIKITDQKGNSYLNKIFKY